MFKDIDSEEKIVLAQMTYLLNKYAYRITSDNGDGESLLRCSGLSTLIDKYEDYLNPHSFNGKWKNDKTQAML